MPKTNSLMTSNWQPTKTLKFSGKKTRNLELHFGCHTCWLSYFPLVCLWHWQRGRHMVTWLPKFLGSIDNQIFLPMLLHCVRFHAWELHYKNSANSGASSSYYIMTTTYVHHTCIAGNCSKFTQHLFLVLARCRLLSVLCWSIISILSICLAPCSSSPMSI